MKNDTELADMPATTEAWLLYGTDCCHLCDRAEELLSIYADAKDIAWQHVDIAGMDNAGMKELSHKIPVLKAGGFELCWPFGLADIDKLYSLIQKY